jgi:methionyl-tRNA synthetase
MYVWVDALTNYITGVGYPDENASLWGFWPANLHVIGKDIVRFHAIYWPAFLMSAGIELPKRVFGHGFVFNRGQKMGKSVGNVIDPFELAHEFGLDQLRYFLLREIPFGQDGSYSDEAIINRTNADLANGIGNLAQRSLSMIAKNCGGIVPQKGELTDDDRAILADATNALEAGRSAMSEQAIHNAVSTVIAVVGSADRYFAGQAPWGLKKTDPARMQTVLWTTAEAVRRIAILMSPYIPASSAKLLDLLAVARDARSFAHLADEHALVPGAELPEPVGVFPRYVLQDRTDA